jgi:hypothetical protein
VREDREREKTMGDEKPNGKPKKKNIDKWRRASK